MRRWYVYKDSEDKAWRWVAIPIHETWWQRPQGRRFPQWDMALNYANRMAHTERPEDYRRTSDPEQLAKTLRSLGYQRTTIKDPSGAVCDLTATVRYRNSIHLKAGDDSFLLARHDWKPLADFLLTEARKQEEA